MNYTPPHTLSPLWRLNLMTLLHGDMAKPHCSEACVRGRCGGAGGNDDPSWSPVWLFPLPHEGQFFFFYFYFFWGFAQVRETSPVCQQYSPPFYKKRKKTNVPHSIPTLPLFFSLLLSCEHHTSAMNMEREQRMTAQRWSSDPLP